MESMRKFYVAYRRYLMCGEYEFESIIITLNKGEKANLPTFEEKTKECFGNLKEIISWSLIEE